MPLQIMVCVLQMLLLCSVHTHLWFNAGVYLQNSKKDCQAFHE